MFTYTDEQTFCLYSPAQSMPSVNMPITQSAQPPVIHARAGDHTCCLVSTFTIHTMEKYINMFFLPSTVVWIQLLLLLLFLFFVGLLFIQHAFAH